VQRAGRAQGMAWAGRRWVKGGGREGGAMASASLIQGGPWHGLPASLFPYRRRRPSHLTTSHSISSHICSGRKASCRRRRREEERRKKGRRETNHHIKVCRPSTLSLNISLKGPPQGRKERRNLLSYLTPPLGKKEETSQAAPLKRNRSIKEVGGG